MNNIYAVGGLLGGSVALDISSRMKVVKRHHTSYLFQSFSNIKKKNRKGKKEREKEEKKVEREKKNSKKKRKKTKRKEESTTREMTHLAVWTSDGQNTHKRQGEAGGDLPPTV